MFRSYWRSLVNKNLGATAPRRPSRKARIRLNLEVLEQRTTPTVFTVNTVADTVAVNFATGQDANGNVSLRSAVQASETLGIPNTIILPAANAYQLTRAGDSGNDSSGTLFITGNVNLTITGAGAKAVVITASAINDGVFGIGPGATVTISGVTITGGNKIGAGGGIDNDGTLSLTNCVLAGNTAAGSTGGTPVAGTVNGFGGGIYNSGALTVTDCTLSGNQAIGGRGGAGGAGAGAGGGGGGGFGGGIFNDAGGTVRLNSTTLVGNTAMGGEGGGYSILAGNGPGGGGGGAGGAGSNNGSSGGAGGFGGGGGGGGTGGAGGFGGGGGGAGGAGGFGAGNGSGRFGGDGAGLGAGFFNNSSGSVQIVNCTLTGNSARGEVEFPTDAGIGGGIFNNTGAISVQNTIIAGNAAAISSPDVFGTGYASDGFNLIGDGTGSSGFRSVTDQVGSSGSKINPMLGVLADNGGPTPTCAPLPGSRAIDMGYDAGGAPTDQRGLRRTYVAPGVVLQDSDGTDVGAVEAGSPDVVFVVGADHSLTQTSYTGSVQLSPAGTVLAATSSLDFRGDGFVVFAITADSHLWKHGAGGWQLLSAGSFQSVSAAANANGNAVVFGVLSDNSLWENSSLNPGGWAMLSPAGTVLSISAIQDVSNADLVFAVTANHQLWEHTPAGWSLLSAGNFLSISAGLNAASQAEVFGVLADNSLWEHNPASSGNGWSNLSPAGTVLSVAAGGRDEVFAITSDHHLWAHTAGGWALLSTGNFASVSGGESAGEVFAVLGDDSLWAYNPGYADQPWVNLLLAGTALADAAPRLV